MLCCGASGTGCRYVITSTCFLQLCRYAASIRMLLMSACSSCIVCPRFCRTPAVTDPFNTTAPFPLRHVFYAFHALACCHGYACLQYCQSDPRASSMRLTHGLDVPHVASAALYLGKHILATVSYAVSADGVVWCWVCTFSTFVALCSDACLAVFVLVTHLLPWALGQRYCAPLICTGGRFNPMQEYTSPTC